MKHKNLHFLSTIALIFISFQALAITTTLTSISPKELVTNWTYITFEFGSDVLDARFRCSLDDQDFTPCTSPYKLSHLRDGQHRFRVYADSPTEGLDRIGATHDWRVDTVPPTTTLNIQNPSRDVYIADILSSEPNSTFLCIIDGQPFFACKSPYTLSGLPNGAHKFETYAIDEAGNMDPQGASFSFTVMARTLTTTITQVQPPSTYTSQAQIQLSFISNEPTADFLCTLGGHTVACTSPWSYGGLSDGNYTFSVHSKDNFGNYDAVGASHSWTIDTIPPIGIFGRLDSTSTSVTITWETNEPTTTELNWGIEPDLSRVAPADLQPTTTHTVRLLGLSSNTLFAVQPFGIDRAGNPYRMPKYLIRTKR